VRVLVVNAGSSSLKVDIIEDGEAVESRDGLPAVAPMVDAVGTASCTAGRTSSSPW